MEPRYACRRNGVSLQIYAHVQLHLCKIYKTQHRTAMVWHPHPRNNNAFYPGESWEELEWMQRYAYMLIKQASDRANHLEAKRRFACDQRLLTVPKKYQLVRQTAAVR